MMPAPSYRACVDKGDATQLTDGNRIPRDQKPYEQKEYVAWKTMPDPPVEVIIDLEDIHAIDAVIVSTGSSVRAGPYTAMLPSVIIAVSDDKGMNVGAPYVSGAEVKATALKNGKGKKITVFTYKPKKGYSRKLGHRQPYTKVRIDSIKA